MVDALPVILSIQAAVNATFGATGNKGIGNCRNIKDTNTPSQHAWGNAIDLDVYGYTAQKPYVAYLETLPQVGTILWASNRPSDHTDHIHVEGLPKQTGTPPCMGGSGTVNTDPGTWVNCKLMASETYPTVWVCQTSLDPNGKQWTLTADSNPDGQPVTGAAAGESLLDRLNPLSGLGDSIGEIALRILYGVVGIGALVLGGMLISNEVKGTAAAQVVGPIAGKVTSAGKSNG